jgi:hypothetical protein
MQKQIICVSLMLWLITLPCLAQQFPTDGIYLKHYDRKECLARVEAQIEKIKKAMLTMPSGQHDQFLNSHSRDRYRTGLPITPNQRQRVYAPKPPSQPNSAENTLRMMARFDAMRRSCR